MKRFIVSSFLLLSPVILFAQSTESLRITHGPWLQNVTKEGATVCFTTNLPAVPGVLLTSRGTLPDTLIRNSTDGMIDAGGTLHKVRISGLEPGKSYSYKVNPVEILKLKPYQVYFGDTIKSKEYKFTTQNNVNKTTRFLVVNDIHTSGKRLSQHLNSGGAASLDLVFYNGDMVDVFEDEAQLLDSIIDTSVRCFAASVPFVYIRGNHETRGILSRKLKGYLDYPQDRYYYSFDQGPVHFIVLDCGEDKPDNNQYYYGLADYDRYRLAELEWLKEEVKSEAFRNAAYRVYLIHMPVHPGDGSSHSLLFLSDNFGPVIKEAGGDLMIAAHTHRHLWLPEKLSGLGIPLLINGNLNRIEAEAGEQSLKIKVISETNEVVLEKEIIKRQ
ncbi:MAG: FN3 domain-containing metallophosphoesterase family protein [Bacteroidota bacterium]